MQVQRHSAKILASGWLIACTAAVTLGEALRLGPAEAAYAWPLLGPASWVPRLLLPLAMVMLALTVILLLLGSAFARAHHLQKPWARLLIVHPLLLAFIWLVWPASGRQPWTGVSSLPLLLAAAGIATAMVLGRRGGFHLLGPWPHWTEFRRDGIFLLIIGGAGLLAGHPVVGSKLISAMVLYPLFALVQLTVMLIMPAHDLRRCGLSTRGTAISCALVFGLLHWPNPLVTAATAVAMFFWTQDRIKGRSLISLALSMGLLGAAFSQMLPDLWTAHLRIGPGYVRRLVREDIAAGNLWFATNHNDWSETPPRLTEFLTAIYPGIVGRDLQSQELGVWEKALDRSRRKTIIWQFLTSVEYDKKRLLGPRPLPGEMSPDVQLHWQGIIEKLDSQSYWEEHGAHWGGYITGIYQDLLGRTPSTTELAAWSDHLSLIQQRQILEVLLGHAFQWRDHPPQVITPGKLIAPQAPILVDKS